MNTHNIHFCGEIRKISGVMFVLPLFWLLKKVPIQISFLETQGVDKKLDKV